MGRIIQTIFYRPILFFFFLPLSYLLLGIIFSLPYGDFQWLPFLMLYIFSISNQMLENMLMRIPTEAFKLSKKLLGALNIINLFVLVYFGLQYSWIASLILALYSGFIQMQFIVFYYNLEHLAAVIAAGFKVILLNSMSFYSQAHFLHPSNFVYYAGLLLPFYIYEAAGFSGPAFEKWLPYLTGASVLIGIVILWPHAAWWSFSLLLSLPFAWNLKTDFNRMASAVYAGIYALIYFSVLWTYV